MMERECRTCKELLQAAQGALVRHIDTLSRLRLANIRFEHDAVDALKAAVEEAWRERERTITVLRQHFATHPGEQMGETAKGA